MSGGGAAERWLRTLDRVQRGLNHAFSNRAAAVSALVTVLEAGDEELHARLRGEASALEEVLRLMRLLPRSPDARAEAVQAADLVPDAVTLMRQVSALRDRSVTVTGLEEAPPLRCRPQGLQQALVFLLVAVGDADGEARLDVAADGEAVTFGVGVSAGAPADAPGEPDTASETALWLLTGDEACCWPAGSGWRLRLPTLAAIRASERRSAASAG